MTPKELLLFPGCSLEGTGREYGQSTLAVLEALGRPVRVLDDWNCCGATAARHVDLGLSVRLSGRNLALAAKQNCDVLVNCAACYNNLSHCRHYLDEHRDAWRSLDGLPSPNDAEVYHLLTLLSGEAMIDGLKQKIVRPLDDMRLACYYGCLLLRPDAYTHVDDPENPQSMEALMGLCGAETIDWSYKTDCCGGSYSVTRKDTCLDLMSRIFASAVEQGATAFVTACPLCQMNLDAWQGQVAKQIGREVKMPVYYVTELLALAMGLDGVEKWLKSHLTDARPTVRSCR